MSLAVGPGVIAHLSPFLLKKNKLIIFEVEPIPCSFIDAFEVTSALGLVVVCIFVVF